MTPTIITTDSLARAAHDEALGTVPLGAIALHRSPRERAALVRRADEALDAFSRSEPRSHLPEESTRALSWRFSRARYHGVVARAGGEPTRAGTVPGSSRARRSEPSRITSELPLHPGLSLDHDFHAELGSTTETPTSESELREVSRSARAHLTRAYRLLERSRNRGTGPARRRALIRQAAEECREAYGLRDWLREHGTGASPEIRARLNRFVEHGGWAEVGRQISAAMNHEGMATE